MAFMTKNETFLNVVVNRMSYSWKTPISTITKYEPPVRYKGLIFPLECV